MYNKTCVECNEEIETIICHNCGHFNCSCGNFDSCGFQTGDACVNCNTVAAECIKCGKETTNLIWWIVPKDDLECINGYSEITIDSELQEAYKYIFDIRCFNSIEEVKETYYILYPPFIVSVDTKITGNGKEIRYIDDQTLLVFLCNNCNSKTYIDCD